MYIKIHYDPAIYPPFELIELPAADSGDFLKACCKAIDCDCIEVIPTVISGLILIIDESGKLRDGWQAKHNIIATTLYGRRGLVDQIVGDVILARVRDDEIVPLTQSDVDRIMRLL